MGHLHTAAHKKMMSDLKKAWWARVKRNPKKYKAVCAKIKKNNARHFLGKRGAQTGGWKGGRYTTSRDKYIYVWAPDHPNAKRNGKGGGGYVLEHRLVMEKKIGRYLTKDEDVNHINGVKDDNRLENLSLVSHFAHYEKHGCPNCGFKFLIR